MALIRGKARYAKIVGKPVKGYEDGEFNKEWAFDLVLDAKGVAQMTEEGLGPKIKQTPEGEQYISFKKKAYYKDPKDANAFVSADPIKIVDGKNNLWGSALIGNGSVLNVKYLVKESVYNKKTHLKPIALAVQVWDHVSYEGGDAFSVKEDGDTDGDDVPW